MSQNTETGSSTGGGEHLATKRSLRMEADKNRPPKCKKFEKIDDIFSHYTDLSEFCVGGEIELTENASKIYYASSSGSIQCIDILNSSEEDVARLTNNCSESPFGMGSQSVVDPNVRQAKELKATDFAFQFNPQMKSSVVSQIKKLLGKREFVMEPYKLNVYPEGGHFKRHKDTIKNDKMIASLVICLPIPFEGGALTVENRKGKSANLDWGIPASGSNNISWACFFCSCDHFISKVTKGNRITIAYDIFTDGTKQSSSDDDIKSLPQMYHEQCSNNLQILIKGLDVQKIYGYFPNHVYRFSDTDENSIGLRDKLKGNDLFLYDIFKEQGWEVVLQVYYPDIESYGPYIEFYTENAICDDVDFDMEEAIDEADKDKLAKLSTLKLLNDEDNCKQQEIHEYEICCGYTGNEPEGEPRHYYAGTIMVLRHQIKCEIKEEKKELA